MRPHVGRGLRPVRRLDGILVVVQSLIRRQRSQWLATNHFGPYLVWRAVGLGPIRSIGWSCQALAPIYFIPTVLLNLHLQQVPNPYLLVARKRLLRVNCAENLEFDQRWELEIRNGSEAYPQLENTGPVSPVSTKANGLPPWFIPNTCWTPWWGEEHRASEKYTAYMTSSNKKLNETFQNQTQRMRQQTSPDSLLLNLWGRYA